MEWTYPDFSRMQCPRDMPHYANHQDLNCLPPWKGEKPIPFTFPTDLPVRTRVAAHKVDDEYISKYLRAIRQMMDLPPEDPRSFGQQANVHCCYCHGCYYMDKTEKIFSVHGGWFFLAWHRWFLYFHERILMTLIDDDTFALPYWNWDFEDGMKIPPMYLKPGLPLFDPRRNPAHGPLSIVDLNYSQGKAPQCEEQQILSNYRLMYKQIVSGAKTTRAFHGAPRRSTGTDSGCTCGEGTLEQAPHNVVHNWTGSPPSTEQCQCPTRTCYGEDMGIFYSAGRDPIFYAHHANVDRMWTIWQQLPGRNDYCDPYLRNSEFYFYDENKRLVSVKAGDAFQHEMLRYKYEDSPTPWLHKPSAMAIPLLPPGEAFSPVPLLPSEDLNFYGPVKVSLLVAPLMRGAAQLELHAGNFNFSVLLLLEGIRVQRNLAVKFDVFINLDDRFLSIPYADYVDKVPTEFAGTFVMLPRGGVETGCGQSSMCVDISEILSDLNVTAGDEISVTLVPRVQLDDAIRVSSIKFQLE